MASKKQQREARLARERLQTYAARHEVHERRSKRRLRDNIVAIVGVVVVGALAAVVQLVYFTSGPGAPEPEPTETAGVNVGVPDPSYSENRAWEGQLVLNDVTLGIELDGEKAPQATAAFIADVEDDYFPGKTCHRLATDPGFQLLQCGSFDGTGAGDPDFRYGPIENSPVDDLYPAGTIAMARVSGDAYSNGHQFFIVFGESTIPSDNVGGYTIIGHVTSGLDELIAKIADAGIDPDALGADGTGAPAIPVTITSVRLDDLETE